MGVGGKNLGPLVLPPDTTRITVGVRLLPGAVELTEPPGETASVLDVPATDPIVVEILSASTAGQGRQVTLQRRAEQGVPVGLGSSRGFGRVHNSVLPLSVAFGGISFGCLGRGFPVEALLVSLHAL